MFVLQILLEIKKKKKLSLLLKITRKKEYVFYDKFYVWHY